MAWCIWVYLALVFLRVCCIGILHGKPCKAEYNIGFALLTAGVALVLLYFGGAFHAIGLN